MVGDSDQMATLVSDNETVQEIREPTAAIDLEVGTDDEFGEALAITLAASMYDFEDGGRKRR